MKLKKFSRLKGILRLKSGLHIGSGEKPHYGEPLPVLKSVISLLPYIPGSSLKGKIRSLLEIAYGKTTNGNPCSCGTCPICLLFGSGDPQKTTQPSRLIFRDSFPTEKSKNILEERDVEKKAGVRIDRETGKAAVGALYSLERVPEGMEFEFEVSIRVFENDDIESVKKWLQLGIYLLEQDALGGGGTRGSGFVEFDKLLLDGKEFESNWREQIAKEKDQLLETAKITTT